MVFILIVILTTLILSFAAYIIKSHQEMAKLRKELLSHDEILKKAEDNDKSSRQNLKSLEDKLSHAIEDPITHLLGRELFEDRFRHSIDESARYHLTEAVLFIDIDEFNKINLALGYEAGDKFLEEVGKRLETCIRKVDSLARFTKDTFVCLLTQLGKPEAAAIVAQRMLSALNQVFSIQDHALSVTASIGIAIYPTDGQDAATLLRNGEYALRLAKEKGGKTYQFYQEKTQINSQRELLLASSLSDETLMHEFFLYYQPIVNTQDETVFCMDTLLSWEHKTVGTMDAQELFSYAEKQRKLNILTEWTLKKACQQFLAWRSFGFSPKFLGLSISIRQLEMSQFVYRLSKILHELQFNPEWLLLEIYVTETTTQLTFDVLEKAFNMLNYLGIKIAIDHFGDCPFLLSYLRKITIDYLKIDPTMIDDVDVNLKTEGLIKSFAYLANNTSMQLIVTGVQSDEQRNLVQALGCHLMQGRLFSPPLSNEEVTHKMVERTINYR